MATSVPTPTGVLLTSSATEDLVLDPTSLPAEDGSPTAAGHVAPPRALRVHVYSAVPGTPWSGSLTVTARTGGIGGEPWETHPASPAAPGSADVSTISAAGNYTVDCAGFEVKLGHTIGAGGPVAIAVRPVGV